MLVHRKKIINKDKDLFSELKKANHIRPLLILPSLSFALRINAQSRQNPFIT